MTAFVIGNLTEVRRGSDIVAYLSGIDATLAPFDGRFILHGGEKTMLEGDWADRDRALAWYRSDAYRRILPLRAANADGPVMLVDGVDSDHRATDVLD